MCDVSNELSHLTVLSVIFKEWNESDFFFLGKSNFSQWKFFKKEKN